MDKERKRLWQLLYIPAAGYLLENSKKLMKKAFEVNRKE